MALDLKKRWADTKSLYEETVGKRKPSKDFLSFMTRSSTGVEGSLGTFDAALLAYGRDASDPLYAKLVASGTVAKQAMHKYAQVLAERTKKDKLTDPAYTKGLAVLSTDLDAIASAIDEATKSARANAKTVAKALQANGDPAVLVALGNKNAMKSFVPRGASILKDLAAGLAKVNAKPTFDTYRDALNMPLRDIGNTFGASNLQHLGMGSLTQSSAYPGKAIAELAALQWAGGTELSAQQVQTALKAVGPRMAVIKAWFVNAAGG